MIIPMRKLLLLCFITSFQLSVFSQTKVKFHTTLGEFVVELEDSLAPITSGNFKDLVSEKYYDGVTFHRVINNFMIQGGRGASKPTIQDEFHDSLSNVQGTISMANTGQPNSGTTQFFINLVNNTRLDYNKSPLTSKHPVFGKVIENFSVVQAIGRAPVSGSAPTPPIYMDSLRFVVEPVDTNNNQNPNDTTNNQNPTTHKGSIHNVITNQHLEFRVFPNPLVQESKIELSPIKGAIEITIYDLLGNTIEKSTKEINPQNTVIAFGDCFDYELKSGLYLLEIVSENYGRNVTRVTVK